MGICHQNASCESPSQIVLENEVSEIRLALQEYAGALIDRPSEALSAVLEDFLRTHHINSAAELISDLRRQPCRCASLLECLLPGATGFFRPVAIYETLSSQVLPGILAAKCGTDAQQLRIWSAGCASGEEAYSIAMSVCDVMDRGNCVGNVHIVATDIREQALKIAERGLYPASTLLHLAAPYVARYFSRVGDHLLIKPRLRNLVAFTQANLVEPFFLGRFDCIFCLDVLPHLCSAARNTLWQRLQLSVEPGGYIFLGENESLPAPTPFRRHAHGGCVFYERPLAFTASAGK